MALASAVPAAATAAAREADPSTVIEWNQALLRIVRTPGAQPPTVHTTRSFAMVHAAMYRAATVSPSTALVAAVAQAGHDVLAVLYPSAAPDLDALLQAQLATAHDTARGIRIGRTAARRMIELRAADGSTATPPAFPPGTGPGQYRPTPPAFTPPVFTHWSAVTHFVLGRADQFRPAPYPDLTGTRYAGAINEVVELGRDTSTTRTADQTVQARFWPGPIQNYWNEIAQSVLRTTGLMKATRVFAQLNLTFADAVIAFYDAKYHILDVRTALTPVCVRGQTVATVQQPHLGRRFPVPDLGEEVRHRRHEPAVVVVVDGHDAGRAQQLDRVHALLVVHGQQHAEHPGPAEVQQRDVEQGEAFADLRQVLW